MSIKTKLAVIILSLVAIPLLLISSITFSNYKNSMSAGRFKHLQDLARFKAEKIETYFGALRENLETSQGFYNVRKNLPILTRLYKEPDNPDAVAARHILGGQLGRMQKVLDLSDIMLADTSGNIVYVSDSGHYSLDWYRSLDEIRPGSSGRGMKGVYFSDVFMNRLTGNRPEMLAVAPISDTNGIPAGTIIFEIDMAPMYRLIQDTAGFGITGEILIGKKYGSRITYLNPLRYDTAAVLSRHIRIGDKIGLPIQKAIAGETGIGESVDYRGNKVVAAWRYIPFLNWGLVVKIDAREEFAIVTNLQRLVIMILIVVFIMAGIITFSVAQSIARPIEKLSKGAQVVGSGNLDYKVGMDLNDEIGRLSRTFDKMTQDLKETLASRDELNREIEERKAVEREREISIEFLQLVNSAANLDDLIKSAVAFFREKSGFGAVGIRLKKGDDYPYFETRGFPDDFVLAESHLCSRDEEGMPCRTAEGYPVMECMCGNVIQGRSDPSKNFFTKRGSFWSNGTTELLAASTEADRRARTRNRCNGEGYESVGLFALRAGGEAIGLLQLNDGKTGMFSPSSLALWERLSDHLAAAVSKFLAMEALRVSEAGLARAQEISHLGSWELDLTNNRLVWSDEVYRIFGLAPREFGATYEAFLDAVHPDDRNAVDAAYSDSVRDGKDTYEIEHRVVRKVGGEIRFVHEKCEHFRDADGKIIRSAGMVHDITERKLAENALRQLAQDLSRSNKDLEQFAYVASHDLQEPLRAIGGFMGLLKKQYYDKLDDEAREYIDFSVDGAERMRSLIEGLLTFSRVGTRGGGFVSVNMKDALDAALANLKTLIVENNADIGYGPLPVVTADRSQMTQLLQNLIANAVKFHGPLRPEVSVGARRKEGAWEIFVRDNGIGIEPQYFDRIFLIFQRLHTRARYKGTGIGLAVCKKIVERHGGSIRVESVPGNGSTFHFTIPDKGETA